MSPLNPTYQTIRAIQRAFEERDQRVTESEMILQLSKAFNYSEETILEYLTEPLK